jgi:hypothetical protein
MGMVNNKRCVNRRAILVFFDEVAPENKCLGIRQ